MSTESDNQWIKAVAYEERNSTTIYAAIVALQHSVKLQLNLEGYIFTEVRSLPRLYIPLLNTRREGYQPNLPEVEGQLQSKEWLQTVVALDTLMANSNSQTLSYRAGGIDLIKSIQDFLTSKKSVSGFTFIPDYILLTLTGDGSRGFFRSFERIKGQGNDVIQKYSKRVNTRFPAFTIIPINFDEWKTQALIDFASQRLLKPYQSKRLFKPYHCI